MVLNVTSVTACCVKWLKRLEDSTAQLCVNNLKLTGNGLLASLQCSAEMFSLSEKSLRIEKSHMRRLLRTTLCRIQNLPSLLVTTWPSQPRSSHLLDSLPESHTPSTPPAYIILTAPTSSTSMMTSKDSAWMTIEVLQSIRKHSHFTIPSHPHITPIKNKKNSNYGQKKVHALSSPSSLKMIQSIRFNSS